MNTRRALLLLGLIVPAVTYGQDTLTRKTLTLEQAIDLALENNHELAVQRQQVDIARNDVHPGNAGLLPTISLVGDGSYSQGQADVAIRTFTENPSRVDISEDGVVTQQAAAVVQADYVLIGGFSGKYRYRLLQRGETISGYQQEILANQTILSVGELFLEIAKLQRREELLQENQAISEERLQQAQDQFTFGQVTGLAVLRAETDLNQDRSTLDNTRLAKDNLLKDLNFLIGREAEATYEVAVVYQVPPLVSVDTLKQEVLRSNPEGKLQAESILLAQDRLKLSQARWYPRLSAFANYGYRGQKNDVQQLAELQNLGYTVGLSLRYPLYQGGTTRRTLQNKRREVDVEEIRHDQVRTQLINQAVKEHSTLQYLRAQLTREEQNLGTFVENFTRTRERYDNGQATSLDIRDAQTAQLNAKIIISDLQANVLQSFLRLEKLRGRLFGGSSEGSGG